MILPPLDIPLPPPAIVIIENKRVEAIRLLEEAKKAEEARIAQEQARIAEEARRVAEKALQERLSTAYPKSNPFAWGNCTYFVAGILNIPWSGNANRWDDNARRVGYAVDNNPTIGAVAQTDRGWAGHVALVLDVQGDKVLIREMNVRGLNRISLGWQPAKNFKYIHVPV